MIVDLFSGCGGWDVGARAAGIGDPLGLEMDADACASRALHGMPTIRCDVAAYPAERFAGRLAGLIASPPCTDFSLAGKRAGIDGETGALMREVPRWVEAVRPRWVACEQVPPALEWWERFAATFRALGYATWCGLLNAADYGVPQTRTRAVLLASLDRQPRPPEPTHARNPHPVLFGEPLEPWVSMADALGWTGEDSPARTLAGNRAPRWLYEDRDGTRGRIVVRTGNNSMVTGRTGSRAGDGDVQPYERSCDEPAPTLDGKVGGSWTLHTNRGQDERGERQTREADEPAPTFSGKSGAQWALTRPATALMGEARVFRPDHHGDGHPPQSVGAIKLSIADALALQSFPADHALAGTKTSKFRQVGNSVAPRVAEMLLGGLA